MIATARVLEAGRSVDPPWEFIVRLHARTAATMVADRITTAIRRHNMWSRTGRSRYGWSRCLELRAS
jgi:hypothetical protein